jgi:hypothetical protein
MTAEHKQVDF